MICGIPLTFLLSFLPLCSDLSLFSLTATPPYIPEVEDDADTSNFDEIEEPPPQVVFHCHSFSDVSQKLTLSIFSCFLHNCSIFFFLRSWFHRLGVGEGEGGGGELG